MLNTILAGFYERDIRRFITEIQSFSNDENLWKTQGLVKNPGGNLALHLISGMNYLFGTTLANTGYVRQRDKEFTDKHIERSDIVAQLEALIPLITTTLENINLNDEYPIVFDDAKRTNSYVVTQLLLHLNYHLGQVNYLRRMVD